MAQITFTARASREGEADAFNVEVDEVHIDDKGKLADTRVHHIPGTVTYAEFCAHRFSPEFWLALKGKRPAKVEAVEPEPLEAEAVEVEAVEPEIKRGPGRPAKK